MTAKDNLCGHYLHMKQKNTLIRGATYLGVGAFVSKALGAVYRIPLTALISSSGLGIYQMVFPVYALLLDFSGAGVPSALSKLISASNEQKLTHAREYLSVSIKIFTIFGIICSVIMAVFSNTIAIFQGDERATLAYLFLSPAVLFVAILSCFRGFFQGLMDMKPTAVSQIIEQVIKLVLGLALAYAFRQDLTRAVAGATFAITIAELVAFFYLLVLYVFFKRKHEISLPIKYEFKPLAKTLIKTTVPITLIGIIIPLSHVIDSFLIINIISTYRADATSLFGLLSGVVMTVINLPVSICYGVATVAIPSISGEKSEKNKLRNAKKSIFLTLLVSLPCAIGVAILSPTIIEILFKRLTVFEKQTAINLLRMTSVCIVLLSLTQTLNAVLIGKGNNYKPLISMGIGVAVKVAVNVLLIKNPKINVYGGAIGLIACYFTICLINLIMIFKEGTANESKRPFSRECTS